MADISDAQVLFWANTERVALIREYMLQEGMLSADMLQRLRCVELVCIDPVDCCDTSLSSSVRVLRTARRIPTPITMPIHHFHNPVLITSVTSVDGRQVIEFTSEAIVHWGWHGKYTRHLPRSYYRDGYLYVVGFQSPFYITHVDVMGVFFDPEQVREFNLCGEEGNEDCGDDVEYPIPSHLLPLLFERVIAKYVNLALNASSKEPPQDYKDT